MASIDTLVPVLLSAASTVGIAITAASATRLGRKRAEQRQTSSLGGNERLVVFTGEIDLADSEALQEALEAEPKLEGLSPEQLDAIKTTIKQAATATATSPPATTSPTPATSKGQDKTGLIGIVIGGLIALGGPISSPFIAHALEAPPEVDCPTAITQTVSLNKSTPYGWVNLSNDSEYEKQCHLNQVAQQVQQHK